MTQATTDETGRISPYKASKGDHMRSGWTVVDHTDERLIVRNDNETKEMANNAYARLHLFGQLPHPIHSVDSKLTYWFDYEGGHRDIFLTFDDLFIMAGRESHNEYVLDMMHAVRLAEFAERHHMGEDHDTVVREFEDYIAEHGSTQG